MINDPWLIFVAATTCLSATHETCFHMNFSGNCSLSKIITILTVSKSKMKFNIFSFFTFTSTIVNASVDIVLHKRFVDERFKLRAETSFTHEHHYHYGRIKDRFFSFPETNRSMVNECQLVAELDRLKANSRLGEKLSSLLSSLLAILTTNRYGFMYLAIILSHIGFIIVSIFCLLVYSTLSTERDMDTKKFIDPTLRYLESIYLVDLYHRYDKSKFMNRAVALILIRYLYLRVRALYLIVENSISNRKQYTSLNKVQVNFMTVRNFDGHLCDWVKFIKECYQHRCGPSCQSRERRKTMRNLMKSLRRHNKVDSIYYYNMIEFNLCFKSDAILKNNDFLLAREAIELDEVQVGKTMYHDLIVNAGISRKTSKRFEWLKWIFSIYGPDHNYYIPIPFWHLDPKHFVVLLAINAISLSLITILIVLILTAALWSELVSHGLNSDEILSTLTIALANMNKEPRLFFTIAANTVLNIVIAMNLFDNGLLIYCAMFQRARILKVIVMLNEELLFYDQCKQQFDSNFKTLIEHAKMKNRQSSARSGYVSQKFQFDSNKLKPNPHQYHLSRFPSISLSTHNLFSPQDSLMPIRSDVYTNNSFYSTGMDDYELALKNFKNSLGKERLGSFNENIDYIIDLIGVLHDEFSDLKGFFTTSLNVTIVSCTLSAAMFVSMFLKSATTHNATLATIGIIITLIDLLASLLIGATSEFSVSAPKLSNFL